MLPAVVRCSSLTIAHNSTNYYCAHTMALSSPGAKFCLVHWPRPVISRVCFLILTMKGRVVASPRILIASYVVYNL